MQNYEARISQEFELVTSEGAYYFEIGGKLNIKALNKDEALDLAADYIDRQSRHLPTILEEIAPV